ncbi:T9SS type A sorting domain-containing protein [Psychroflexus sp. CAK8W]|uniref:T9SS type A sorting domain-containing protein n=1 Tax=Psychroflexus longus TaxID=2873596 RepID=A0ABS7XKW2_9FLAO|nr:T9SS type A sorting domain-containing protein [Psychroflexus longus]MBZ9778711.1 T9SS type A sorting domain-containing protein [Psychroflexus longus]
MKKIVFLFFALLFTQLSFGQSEIKAMFYNLLDFSSAPPTNRAEILNSILSTYHPDLFMVCEVESQNDAQKILNESFLYTSEEIAQSPFLFNSSGASLIHQLVYYNSEKFTLKYTDQIETNVRSINHYSFVLNTNYKIELEVFVAHFKASIGSENERLFEAQQFVDYIQNFPEEANILLAGDFNMYSSSEPGYQVLLNGTNAFNMIDPIDESGDWNNNVSFAGIHTQSTRISNEEFEGFGAGGGLDDRFDIMLISEVMSSKANTISYVEDSYKAWGNNSNCYNNNINNSDCDGEFGLELRELLYQMSDHLPVVMNLAISDEFLSKPSYNIANSVTFISGNIVSQNLNLKFSPELLFSRSKIYNILGQEVFNFTVSNTNESIDTSTLSSGLYYLKIEQLPTTQKFYVSH